MWLMTYFKGLTKGKVKSYSPQRRLNIFYLDKDDFQIIEFD